MKHEAELGGDVLYEGMRKSEQPGDIVVIRTEVTLAGRVNVDSLDPAPSQKVWSHSGGFEWGYEGSGPAQLALALLLDATGDRDMAVKYHQDFKRNFVAGWKASWQVNAGQIRRWVELRRKYEAIPEVL